MLNTNERRTAQRLDETDAQVMLEALKRIRKIGYQSDFEKLTDAVRKTVCVAEAAILKVERKK